MTLDDELLKKAQSAGARVAEAERLGLLARADYHTAIRRLHLAGGSFREIARALGVSHQRVQQIVDEAGGSWWQRIWHTRNVKRDAVCTFCGRPPSEVSNLIAGPDVYVCDACIESAERILAGTSKPRGGLQAARPGSRAACSFCGKRCSDDRELVMGPRAKVCGECLELCRQILTERAGG